MDAREYSSMGRGEWITLRVTIESQLLIIKDHH